MKSGIYVNRVDNWLDDAERLDFPLGRPGAIATVFLLQLGPGTWRVAWSTQAPGHFARSVIEPSSAARPNRYNAILAGLFGARSHWKEVRVPQLVAGVNQAIRRLEDEL